MTGSRVLHATVDVPQFVGELGVLAEIDRTASVLTLEDSTVWIASADDFLEFLASEPSAARSLLRVLARQVHSHEAFVDDLLFLDLKGRVAKRLLQMATPSLDDLPEDGTAIPAVTHADLASLCGGSRENVTRVLSEFQRRGLLERDGQALRPEEGRRAGEDRRVSDASLPASRPSGVQRGQGDSARVFSRAAVRRHRSISAWFPPTSTSGTAIPRNSRGRV